MTTECGGTTPLNGPQHFDMFPTEPVGNPLGRKMSYQKSDHTRRTERLLRSKIPFLNFGIPWGDAIKRPDAHLSGYLLVGPYCSSHQGFWGAEASQSTDFGMPLRA